MDGVHWGDDIPLDDLDTFFLDHLAADPVMMEHFTAEHVSYFRRVIGIVTNTIARKQLFFYRASCGRLIDHLHDSSNETSLMFTVYRKERGGREYNFTVQFFKDWEFVIGTRNEKEQSAYYDYNRQESAYRGVKLSFLLNKLIFEQI